MMCMALIQTGLIMSVSPPARFISRSTQHILMKSGVRIRSLEATPILPDCAGFVHITIYMSVQYASMETICILYYDISYTILYYEVTHLHCLKRRQEHKF